MLTPQLAALAIDAALREMKSTTPWRSDPYARKRRKAQRARPFVKDGARVQPPSRRAMLKRMMVALANMQHERQRKLELALRDLGVSWRKYTTAVSRKDGAFLKPLWKQMEERGVAAT